MVVPDPVPRSGDFIPEQFCDEVYDYVDDYLAEAMDEMESELQGAAKPGAEKGLEEEIKTACDMVQQRHQREFDRNLDIFDRYVKKNLKAAMPDHAKSTGVRASRTDRERRDGTKPGSTAGRQNTSAAVDGTGPTRSGCVATWGFELDEAAPPKRVEDERALDAELQRLRKRRRETLRRRAALVRKGVRVAAVLQDVNEFVEALQMGVSSSFNDNGLTPLPAKVQEAVESSAQLRTIAEQAQDLTRRVGKRQAQSAGGGRDGEKASSAAAGPEATSPVSGTQDLQDIFEHSQEQQVSAGGVAEFSKLHARLRG